MTFEDYLRRLDAIVAQLDGDAPDLAAALALFEEGVTLLRRASETLATAEGKVELLVREADGALETRELRS